jgi:hypothetical protein
MKLSESDLVEDRFYAMGSGAEALNKICQELVQAGKTSGVIPAFHELLKRNNIPSVGGGFQCGIATKTGFHIRPIINVTAKPAEITFLGFSVSDFSDISGHSIGFEAVSMDAE